MRNTLLTVCTGGLAACGAIVLSALFAAGAAEAQSVRYISIDGDDANACTLAAPCRTLARGVAVTPNLGEVRLLDSGGFGAGVKIGKSLTISGNGNTLILSGPVVVARRSASVVFRGLLFNGRGANPFGVRIDTAASVHIVDCEFEGFADDGIFVDVASIELFVTDTISRNNGDNGLQVEGNGVTTVTLENFHAENNFNGAFVVNAHVNVSNSTFAGNANDGYLQFKGTTSIARSTASGNAASGFTIVDGGKMQLDSSLSRGNVNGIFVGFADGPVAAATARISSLSVTDNAVGIQNGGTVETQGNSTVFSNGDDLAGNDLEAPFTPSRTPGASSRIGASKTR